MAGQALMVQGTASHVGKSVLVSAFCRIFRQDGYSVAPFKAQNMSNNSYVTADGLEIGRAQAVQADAAGVEARVEMNPVLLKPEADHISQVVVMGKPLLTAKARDYFGLKPQLWEAVHTSLDSLREDFDIVVIEGAGSPAEINLKKNEIVNMRVALYANAPVLLCGDIDRGGVFAALVGTLELLEPEERAIIKGMIINKFRGDPSLLTDGITWLEDRTGIPVAGLIHHYRDIHIPEEDSVALDDSPIATHQSVLDVAVLQLPHIANFDDFDPISRHPGVELRYVDSPAQLGRPDLVIIPGTKTTIPDLAWMNERGLTQAVKDLHAGGAAVIGICGGYQMLGMKVSDPEHIESSITELDGLGLLNLTTIFEGSKETHRIKGRVSEATGLLAGAAGMPVTGYEIHMGRTIGEGFSPPFLIQDRADVPVGGDGDLEGAIDASGSVMGTYIHGLFLNPELRGAMLAELGRRKGVSLPDVTTENNLDREYDKLADWIRSSIDMDLIYQMSGLSRKYNAARP
ncbi:MAG: cobyric acid synthase [Dehalococcoidia bacterium]|nr:cobyric acid synthase [Dehalococcoidia bacterium]